MSTTSSAPATGTFRLKTGKHRGERLDSVPVEYLRWCNRTLQFSPDADAIAFHLSELKRKKHELVVPADLGEFRLVGTWNHGERLRDVDKDELARYLWKHADAKQSVVILDYLVSIGVPPVRTHDDPRVARPHVLHDVDADVAVEDIVLTGGRYEGVALRAVPFSHVVWYVCQLPAELRTAEMLDYMQARCTAYVEAERERVTDPEGIGTRKAVA